VDVEVGVVLTDSALFDGDHTAADLVGYGPIPADLARDLLDEDDGTAVGKQDGASEGPASSTTGSDALEPEPSVCPAGGRCTSAACTLVHDGSIPIGPPPDVGSARRPPDDVGAAHDAGAQGSGTTQTPRGRDGTRAARVWLRRLYADPTTGVLHVRDPRRRLFTGNLRATLIMRGRYCANAWCGAPVRHVDHTRRWSEGGLTVETNGRGLCARCNLAREHPRHADPDPSSYRDPPPVLDGFLGRPPRAAPQPRAAPDDLPGDASPTRAA
jgi:hypothetical protein